jgi:MYXO-CTERM domain-containing protein
MRELELRRIFTNIAAVSVVTFGTLTMPNAIRAQQQADPTPQQAPGTVTGTEMERDMRETARETADDAEDSANWGWLGLLGLAGLLGLRRRDDSRTIETDTRRF